MKSFVLISFIAAVLFTSLLAGCFDRGTEGILQNKESCEASGGRWGRIGLDVMESCNPSTSDAGKECSDSSECEGSCLAELTEEEEERAWEGEVFHRKGKCAAWRTTVGCRAFVSNGTIYGILCVD